MEMKILLVLLGFVSYIGLSYIVFSVLKKKGIFPVVYDVYTKSEKKTVFFEFSRLLFFLLISLLSVAFVRWEILGVFVLLTLTQLIVLRSKIKEGSEDNCLCEVSIENDENSNKVKRNKKIMLTKEYLYLGEPKWFDFLLLNSKNKIPVFDKMYVYLILSDVYREEEKMIVKFGFLSVPMFKRTIEVPKEYIGQVDELIRELKRIRKEGIKKKKELTFEKKLIEKMIKTKK